MTPPSETTTATANGAALDAGARHVTILGPQRLLPTLAHAVDSLGIEGPIATITAGWQEREPDDQELHEHLGERSVNLRLYERTEKVFSADPKLAEAHRTRQEQFQELQTLYHLRLDYAMQAFYALARRHGDPVLLAAEKKAALESVRELDNHHLGLVREAHEEFEEQWRPHERQAVQEERRELDGILQDIQAIVIAGGHVAVLLNRLRLFDLGAFVPGKTVIAWSAGAMAISEKVVVYHDRPAHGPGHAEVLEVGLGWHRGVVPLPHARWRLRLDDPDRVSLLALRFAPASCVPLDEGARLDSDPSGWTAPPGTLRFAPEGRLVEWRGF